MSDTEAAAEPRPPQITAALIAAMQAVRAVGKNGKNTDQNFRYRKYDDIITAGNKALVEAGVAIVPTVVEVQRTQREVTTSKQARRTVTTTMVHMRYKLTCAADGSFEVADWYGEASDYGDKSLGKSKSYALKMFLIDLLKIPVDDPDADPDGHSHADDAPAGAGAPRRQQARPPRQRSRSSKPRQAAPPVETDPALLASITDDLAPFHDDPVAAGGNEALRAIWERVEAARVAGTISGADWDNVARMIRVIQEEIEDLARTARRELTSARPDSAEPDPWADAPVRRFNPDTMRNEPADAAPSGTPQPEQAPTDTGATTEAAPAAQTAETGGEDTDATA